MKKIIVIILLSLCYIHGFSQDTLYTKNKAPIPVKVIEINETEIKYKAFLNPDGPLYIVKKSNVVKIVYQNGSVDMLTEPKVSPVVPQKTADPLHLMKGHNTFSIVVSDFIFSMVTGSYERSFLSDHLSIRIPFSYGFNANGNDTIHIDYSDDFFDFSFQNQAYYSKNKIFSTGADVFIYPFKTGTANYFVGSSFGYGEFNYWSEFYTGNPNLPYLYRKDAITYYSYLIKNGVNFLPSKHLSVSLSLAMGFSKLKMKYYGSGYDQSYNSSSEIRRAVEAGFSIGYRF